MNLSNSLLLAILIPAVVTAAEPRRLTSDGTLKSHPLFIGTSGDSILFEQQATPTQLQLVKLDLAESSLQPLHPKETRSEMEPAISADGQHVAYIQNRGNLSLALVLEDLESGRTVDLPPGGGFSGYHTPAFAADGGSLAFCFADKGRQAVEVVRRDGKDRHVLIGGEGVHIAPCFSADGTRLVFSSTRDGNYELYSAKSDGTNLVRLTKNDRQDLRPKFSPDGSRIVFTTARDGNYEIYVMDADGVNARRITDHPERDDYPSWHPNGRQILFVGERKGAFDLYLADLP